MFHRIDGDPLDLPSSRFFRMAKRLPVRGGAVTAALAAVQTADEVPRREVMTARPAAETAADVDNSAEIASMAAMSQNPGFPGIGYSGG